MSEGLRATMRRARAAYLLFEHNHPDADPDILAREWGSDSELRDFWLKQVEVVVKALGARS